MKQKVAALLAVIVLSVTASSQNEKTLPAPGPEPTNPQREKTLILPGQEPSKGIPEERRKPPLMDQDPIREAEESESKESDLRKQLLEGLKKIYGRSELEIQNLNAKTEHGDTASGVEVLRTAEEITIDTTPCGKKKNLVTFHQLYKKDEVGDVTCGGKKYKKVSVEQQ